MDNISSIEQFNQTIDDDMNGIQSINAAVGIITNNENVLANEDYSNVNKQTIMETTAGLLGCPVFEVSNEGVKDVLKTIIASLKKFLAKIWEKIMKLVKQVIKYISSDEKEIDSMIKNTKNFSNESRDRTISEQVYQIPEFLIPTTNTPDSLIKLKYLINKLKEIRLSTYRSMIDYIQYTYDELGRDDIINMNFIPFKDYFYNTTVGIYDNDLELSTILAGIKDTFDTYTNGFKFIIGYDKKNMHVIMPLYPESSVMRVPCDRGDLVIDTNLFFTNYINNHLLELKDHKSYIIREEDDVIAISKLIRSTKDMLHNNTDNYGDNQGNLNIIHKYIKEISVGIPQIIRSLNMCNLVMYSEYKQILKNIYKAEYETK